MLFRSSGLRLIITRLPEHVRLPVDLPIQDRLLAVGELERMQHTKSPARSGRYYSFDMSTNRGGIESNQHLGVRRKWIPLAHRVGLNPAFGRFYCPRISFIEKFSNSQPYRTLRSQPLPSDILHIRHNANRRRFQPKWRLLSPQSRGLLLPVGVAEWMVQILQFRVEKSSEGWKPTDSDTTDSSP